MTAKAFKAGQRIVFPAPHDKIIAYFQRIRYRGQEPIIEYIDKHGRLQAINGYDLLDCNHA